MDFERCLCVFTLFLQTLSLQRLVPCHLQSLLFQLCLLLLFPLHQGRLAEGKTVNSQHRLNRWHRCRWDHHYLDYRIKFSALLFFNGWHVNKLLTRLNYFTCNTSVSVCFSPASLSLQVLWTYWLPLLCGWSTPGWSFRAPSFTTQTFGPPTTPAFWVNSLHTISIFSPHI